MRGEGKPPPRPKVRPGLRPVGSEPIQNWTPPTSIPDPARPPLVTPVAPPRNPPAPPPLPEVLPEPNRTNSRPPRRRVRAGKATDTGTVLTYRELEVLQLAALGLSNEMIGGALFLAVDTVKTHLKRINDKLGTSTRTTAVVAGITLGVIVCPCPRCKDAERQGRPDARQTP